MTHMRIENIAPMLYLLPKEFDEALLGYAESGTGRAIVLPVYDKTKVLTIAESSKEYPMSVLTKWRAEDDAPLLLNRMSRQMAEEQNELYGLFMYAKGKNAKAIAGLAGTWEEEECWCYDMCEASDGNEREAQLILRYDLPGNNVCFLCGTSEKDISVIKEKALRYIY